ncbi:TPA: hypothetical protein ACH3X1_001238 [Trebouxia sp. C0004]
MLVPPKFQTVSVRCTGACMRGGPSSSKRVRSPSVQEVSTGSHRPFSGVRGRVYSAGQAELQHSSQPGRSNSFSPTNQGDPEQHEDDQRIDWQPISPDGAQDSARLHSSDKRSRRQHTREQQYFHWQEDLPQMYIAALVPWLVSSSINQTCSAECRVNLHIESMQQTRRAGTATQVNTSKLCYHQQQSRMPAHMLTSLFTSQS